jgi:hypothetical protein
MCAWHVRVLSGSGDAALEVEAATLDSTHVLVSPLFGEGV